MNMHERIKGGKLFTDMCEGMPQERDEAKRKMIAFNNTTPDNIAERRKIQNEMLHEKSGAADIEPPIYFRYGKHILVGEGTCIDLNCNFIDDGMITIGKNVIIGPAVTVITSGRPVRPDMREYKYADPVTIKDNVLIGANVTVFPGVTIGENSVIEPGSVVSKDIPANVIAGGNPCKESREISDKDNEYYYRRRKISDKDLEEERSLRANDQPVATKAAPAAKAEEAAKAEPERSDIPVEPMDPEFLRSIGLSEADVRTVQEKESRDAGLSSDTDDSEEKLPQRSDNPNRYHRIANTGPVAQDNGEPSPFKPLGSNKPSAAATPDEPAEPSPFKPIAPSAAEIAKEDTAPSPFKAAKPAVEEEPSNNPFKAAAASNAPAPGLFKPVGGGNSAVADEPSEPSPFKPLAVNPADEVKEEEAPSPFKAIKETAVEYPSDDESNNPFKAAASSQGAPAPGLFKPNGSKGAAKKSEPQPHGAIGTGLLKPTGNIGATEGLSGRVSESEHLDSFGSLGSDEGSLSGGLQSGSSGASESLLGSGSSLSSGSSESKLPQRSESTNSYYPTKHSSSALGSSEPSPFKPMGGAKTAPEAAEEPSSSPFKPTGNAVPGFGVGAQPEAAEPSPFKPIGNTAQSNSAADPEPAEASPFKPAGNAVPGFGVGAQPVEAEPSPFKPIANAVPDAEPEQNSAPFAPVKPEASLEDIPAPGPAPAADPHEYSPFKPINFSDLDDLPPLDESAPSPFKPLR